MGTAVLASVAYAGSSSNTGLVAGDHQSLVYRHNDGNCKRVVWKGHYYLNLYGVLHHIPNDATYNNLFKNRNAETIDDATYNSAIFGPPLTNGAYIAKT